MHRITAKATSKNLYANLLPWAWNMKPDASISLVECSPELGHSRNLHEKAFFDVPSVGVDSHSLQPLQARQRVPQRLGLLG